MSRDISPSTITRGTVRPGAVTRRVGYVIAALVNLVLLWLVIGWPGWRAVPFLTDETQKVIAIVVVSLLAGVVVNLVNFVFDPAWLKVLGEIVTSAIALSVLVRLWEVFPFGFGSSNVDWVFVTRMVIAAAIFGCSVSIIVQIVLLVRAAFRAGSGESLSLSSSEREGRRGKGDG